MRTAVSKLLAGIALCLPLLSHASDKMLVLVPAILDPAAPIDYNVKNECGVEMLIGNQALQRVNERFGGTAQAVDKEETTADPLLKVTILSVHGIGGGSWTGPKSISVKAQIMQNGQAAQSTILQRTSSGGFFGGMTGTCAIMERIAVTLGKDIANWTAMAARLNETKPGPTAETQAAASPVGEMPTVEAK